MINVLFAGNSMVFDGILTTMLSICKRTKSIEPIHIFIFTMDITRVKPEYTSVTDKQVAFLNMVLETYNKDSCVTLIDVGELYEQEFAYCPNEKAYCSPYTLLRLLADLVPDIPDKILYLDIDVLFNKDIALLYDTNIDNYEYASAKDHYGKFLIRPNYINAGVILFNIKKCRETKLLSKARELIRSKKLTFADQDAIYWSTSKRLILPQKFNDQRCLWRHTIVRHFSKRLYWLPYPHTANIKQWNVSLVHRVLKYYAFDDILYEYIYWKQYFERNF